MPVIGWPEFDPPRVIKIFCTFVSSLKKKSAARFNENWRICLQFAMF